MMLPTHALVGLAIASPLAAYAPELAPFALVGGLVGGVLPDLDMYAGHRKRLHFPTVYPVLAVPATFLAVTVTTPWTVALSLIFVAAAVHCRMDVYGGGLELRPWEATSERAVYDHVDGTWHEPRRVVAYDGSPGDLVLSAVVGLPLYVALDGLFAAVVVAALVVAAAYTVLRRPLAAAAPAVFDRVPEPLAEHVPSRYRTDP